jgi:hypothetical protein
MRGECRLTVTASQRGRRTIGRPGRSWPYISRRLWRSPREKGSGAVAAAGIPIALGSWWGVLIVVAMMPAAIWRLFDVEKFLAGNLPCYVEYQNKVRYRLIPLVW